MLRKYLANIQIDQGAILWAGKKSGWIFKLSAVVVVVNFVAHRSIDDLNTGGCAGQGTATPEQEKEEGEVSATKMIIVGAISIRRDGL